MKKVEFIAELRKKLSGLPKQEVEERLNFYIEMIDDRIEDGLSEEEAVSQAGTVDEIASQIIADIPLIKIAKERITTKKRLGALATLLLALGSPIWLSLCIAALSVLLSVYAVLWSLIVSAWAVFAAFAVSAPAGVVTGIVFSFSGNAPAGIGIIGASIVCAGLAILAFFGCLAATKGTVRLTKMIGLGIKKCFVKKEEE